MGRQLGGAIGADHDKLGRIMATPLPECMKRWYPQTLKTLDFGYFNKNVCKTPENIYTSKSQIFFENLEAIHKIIF